MWKEKSCSYGRMDLLWREYFMDPSVWIDSRSSKSSSKFPDFKHKTNCEPLWIDGWCNPFWVHEEVKRQGIVVSIGILDKGVVSENLQQECHAFMALLKSCTLKKDLNEGSRLHAEILKRGLLENNPYLASSLINMYSKCGLLAKAQKVLEVLCVRNVVTWSALIGGYAQQGQGHEALECFEQMKREGIFPNMVTFTCILKACGSTGSIKKGERIHHEIVSKGLLEKDIILGTALVDMYAKCGVLTKAQNVLEELPARNLLSWSALIAGYAQQGQGHEALNCFDQMESEGFSPNAVTFICILKACGSIGAIDKGKQIHEQIVSRGLLKNHIVLGTALTDMYAKCGELGKAKQVLEELSIRDIASWNALISGYAQQGQGNEALKCFDQMQSEGFSPNAITFISILKACCCTGTLEKGKQIHKEIMNRDMLEHDYVLGNALVDMYAKCGALAKAQEVLKELVFQGVTSWNALIAGYAQHGRCHEAMECFEQMQSKGLLANEITFICILKACGSKGALEKGKEIHDEISSRGLVQKNIVLGTALVDMYAKCGVLANAQKALNELPVRNVVSWNSLIAGYSHQGQGEEALNCLQWMQRESISPNSVTLLCVLSACNRSGLLDKARILFENMSREYGIMPNVEHYSCMMVSFGCAGHFDKAISALKLIPSCKCLAVWLALLSTCRKWGNVKLGRMAFYQAVELDRDCGTAYALMAEIFAAAGMQEDAEMVKSMRLKYDVV